MTARLLRTATVLVLLIGLAAASASADTIRVQSTTDTVDAGLVDGLLQPLYAQVQPGDSLQYTPVGTGAALQHARDGLADVVITHAPSLEQQFVADGFSLEPSGRAIFYSDYVIVGPTGDPAGVKATAPHDAISALEAIAAAGAGGTATFVSRGDNSGTNVQEQIMWGLTSTVTKQIASNAGSATNRYEPGSGGTYPTWYGKTNKGQAANLLDADACSAGTYPNGGCYTMVDRGTFNKAVDTGTVTHLAIVSQRNTAAARGGKDLLVNPFSVYIVNPEKIAAVDPLAPAVNVAAAQRFVAFLTSRRFQDAVDTFPTTTDPAFHADAFPLVTRTSPLAPTATAGAKLTLSLVLANRQPGAPPVAGMPVQLQQSTNGGTTWTDTGPSRLTDASGEVTLTPTIARTTAYRVSLPRFQTTSWNAFSPSTQELGVVSVAAAPPPTKLDRVAPNLSRLALKRTLLTLRITEPGTLEATIAKRIVRRVRRHGHVHTRVTLRTARTVTLTVTHKGLVTLRWKRPLPPGTYRITLRATDAVGNVRVHRAVFRVKQRDHLRR
ncbi:MAG TPA: substrate-binding domain-containing protein [Conexibacter sp.]|nr:substrate-binding domain-containing protein [Conexibacter sp.]